MCLTPKFAGITSFRPASDTQLLNDNAYVRHAQTLTPYVPPKYPSPLLPVAFIADIRLCFQSMGHAAAPREATAEHELDESTAEVGRFLSDEAILRVKLGTRTVHSNGDGTSDGGAATVLVVDEDHLQKVLAEVPKAGLSVVHQTK